MKRLFVSILAALCAVTTMRAQTALEEITKDPGKSGGVYYAYPAPTTDQTPAPKGYKAFYISHYGRHGSRYMLSDEDYRRPLNMLRQARDMGALTPKGQDVLKRMEKIWLEAEFHGDELAPLGKRQHRGIAERMYRSFPHLFTDKGRVTARSTTSMRVALSMVAFCERLKELNPKVNLDWETSRKHMSYLNSHTRRYDALKRDPMGWQRDHNQFCARGIDASRFTSQLISDTSFYRKARVFPNMLMSQLFDVAIDLQDMETEVSLFDIFTPEELYQYWLNGNSWFYNCDADSPYNKGTALESTVPLLQNIIDGVDAAVEGKGDAATLRFGHDGNIIPLASIMRLKGCDANESDLYKVDRVWRNYHVSPMGANIQLILYRKGASDDILVKIMHNEVETSIPVQTDRYPYYRWDDVRSFWLSQIQKHAPKE